MHWRASTRFACRVRTAATQTESYLQALGQRVVAWLVCFHPLLGHDIVTSCVLGSNATATTTGAEHIKRKYTISTMNKERARKQVSHAMQLCAVVVLMVHVSPMITAARVVVLGTVVGSCSCAESHWRVLLGCRLCMLSVGEPPGRVLADRRAYNRNGPPSSGLKARITPCWP